MVRRHEEMQEEVAKDMIEMAKSLRENSLVAKRIIHQDTEVRVSTELILLQYTSCTYVPQRVLL